ncbi:DUF502 domain-containing protein [Alicyclobacillus vulcanalis]|uniref:Uncharacterized membrane protein n=1 Tax=Alicyclobacillus vulcanalis TaxID=252246 RepID=A0A1N7KT71_9BACL|nr:DUF502 domain-containing protein [Alicyclobacillus vulcanalis]SIS64630.1 Uncharacterized membrane protein [Alicyclobacillus vulcanalis]
MNWVKEMLRKLAQYLGIGLATVLPFALAIWVVVFVVNQVDGLVSWYIPWVYLHIPGLGFAIVLAALFVIGLLSRAYVSRIVLQWADRLFTHIPVVRTVYTTVKELIENLFRRRTAFQTPVLVMWPDDRAQVLGFITSETLPEALDPDGRLVAVYLPNAFQFAGVTVLVARDRVKPVDLSVESAWRFALSAGLGQTRGGDPAPAEKAPTPDVSDASDVPHAPDRPQPPPSFRA